MDGVQINAFDGVVLVVLLVGARAGYTYGFAETIWPFLRWTGMLAAGAAAWSPISLELSRLSGFGPLPTAEFAYCFMAGTAALAIAGLYRVFGQQLQLMIPGGVIDSILGMIAGAGASAASLLNAYALLNPFQAKPQWNPESSGYDTAAQDLIIAILGALRQSAFEGSWIGRAISEHLGMLLIQS